MTLAYAILLATTGLGLLVLLGRLVYPPPRLEIGERGILDRSLGWGWIPWEEIEGAYPPTLEQAQVLRLRLRLTERLSRTLRKTRRGVDVGGPTPVRSVEVALDLSDTELNAVEVLQEILAHPACEAEAAPGPSPETSPNRPATA